MSPMRIRTCSLAAAALGALVVAPVAATAADAVIVVRMAPGARVADLGPGAEAVVGTATAHRLTEAAGRRGRRAPDLSRWALVRASHGRAAVVRARLLFRGDVLSATVEPASTPPPPAQQCRVLPASMGVPPFAAGPGGVPQSLSEFDDMRRHLDMTSLPAGGDGAGVRVADIEYDWDPDHVELADRHLPEPYRPGTTNPANISHGTAVLSVIGGKADGIGITGLAPAVELLPVGPWDGTVYSPASAIAAAADRLQPGDVLLVEQQSYARGPADTGAYGEPVAAAIAAASAKGIVVVLPAGNGASDIASYGTPATDTALVVGGGTIPEGADVLAARHPASNAGARIDVQGPAHSVTAGTAAPGYYPFLLGGADTPGRAYTHCFNGTSSSAAVVAGAVAAMQGIARAARGTPFTPEEVRQRLVATGLPQVDPEHGWVGPLPRVAAAADLTPPPPPTIIAPLSGTVGFGTMRVTWRSEAEAGGGRPPDTVLLDGTEVARVPAGIGELIMTVPAGPHRLTVRAIDIVGNVAESTADLVGVDPATVVPGAYSIPPPPSRTVSGTSAVLPSVRGISARWVPRTRVMALTLRAPVQGTRVTVAGRSVALRSGRVTLVMPPGSSRIVVAHAQGFLAVRFRVDVTVRGLVRVATISAPRGVTR